MFTTCIYYFLRIIVGIFKSLLNCIIHELYNNLVESMGCSSLYRKMLIRKISELLSERYRIKTQAHIINMLTTIPDKWIAFSLTQHVILSPCLSLPVLEGR